MSAESQRFHFMDAMRGMLMMLGVVLHSAQVYNPEKDWLIYSEGGAAVARFLVDAIHVFRMPAFFVISGFFCVLTAQRYGPRILITSRITRILIPLIVTALTLNSAQAILLKTTGWENYSLQEYVATGAWVSHLWFLVDLMVYFVAAYVLIAIARAPMVWLGRLIISFALSLPVVVLVLALPFSNIAIYALEDIGLPIHGNFYGVISGSSLSYYLPFFVFGALLFASRDLLKKFSSVSPLLMIFIIGLATMMMKIVPTDDSLFDVVFEAYLSSLRVWVSVCLCFFVFKQFFGGKSPIGFYLADASYTVYLFHHFFVVLFGILLIKAGVDGVPGMLILIALVSLITFAIHQWGVKPSGTLRFLFNGKRQAGLLPPRLVKVGARE